MKSKEILIHFFRALIRLTGIVFLIAGIINFPNIFVHGGITKNIFTLLLRLINFSSFIITGYWFIRLKKWSILGIFFRIIISIFIPFYNLYFSTNNMFSMETYKFDDAVVYIVIFLFFLTLKNSLFTDNQKINNTLDKTTNNDKDYQHKYLILELVFIVITTIVILIGAYIKGSTLTSTTMITPTFTPTPTPTIAITPTPTNIPIRQDTSNLIPPYKVLNIYDDTNLVSELILIDKNNHQITIDKSDYIKFESENYIGKTFYKDFKFSSDNKFIYYNTYFEKTIIESNLYDIKNGIKTNLTMNGETVGFSNDAKFFYACGIGDLSNMGGGKSQGAIIKQLQSEDIIFESNSRFKCRDNQSNGNLTLYELDYEEYLGTGKEVIISQYNFSKKTGKFLKIK